MLPPCRQPYKIQARQKKSGKEIITANLHKGTNSMTTSLSPQEIIF